jgi:hypothetical protein
MILVAGIRLHAGWLPRAAVGAAVLALLGLAAANPDGLIAERNITRFQQTGRIDTAYLSNLSPDAVPALDRLATLDPVRRDCALAEIHRTLNRDPGDWRGWSYGRAHARTLLAADPPTTNPECPSSYRY